MRNQSLNNKGFGLVAVLIVVAVLVVLGGVGAYAYHQNHKVKTAASNNTSTRSSVQTNSNTHPPQVAQTSAVTSLISDFYSKYIDTQKAVPPQTAQASQLVEQYGTSNLVSYVTPKQGYSYTENAVICAQMFPDSFNVANVTSTSTTATGTVTELFSGKPVEIKVGVVNQSGSLKINSITCSPPLVASPGGP